LGSSLPKYIDNIEVPPIKCQGIKTKLVNFIALNISWDGKGRWIEPFLGSGVVLFNIQPKKALVGDKNKYIIRFYQKIQSGEINGKVVRDFLETHGERLKKEGEDYYYLMRDEFNKEEEKVLHFLFLNRAGFNGMIRFNLDEELNVPFCKKTERFRKAYITKITNQVNAIAKIIRNKDWEFRSSDWKETIKEAKEGDFIYLDPPYIGRHTGYMGKWEQEEAELLARVVQKGKAGFALSMWKRNKYRENEHIEKCWSGLTARTFNHFYHVGPTEDLRNKMEEALIIHNDYVASSSEVKNMTKEPEQLSLFKL